MVTLKTLEKCGCTDERLKKIFTAKEGTPDFEIAKKIKGPMRNRIWEGVEFGAKNYKVHLAADMAWDAPPISKDAVPLMLYAQGKIDLEQCGKSLRGSKIADECIEYEDDKKQKIKGVNIPKLYEISFNLVRSYVTRRHAAQVIRYSDLQPFFKYEPRSTNSVDRLKAETLSQRIQVMVDQFGVKHLHDQAIRDMFMYAETVIFPAASWKESESSYLSDENKVITYTSCEGVDLVMPHPTMRFHDRSRPLANLNTDNGPEYIGYWDIVPYRDIKNNPSFYNTDKVTYGSGLWKTVQGYRAFFEACRPTAVKHTMKQYGSLDSIPTSNNRKETLGEYSQNDGDSACFYTSYFVKVNPNNLRIGTYGHDVWLRLVVASDDTVIFAEFMPSIPGCYGGVNCNDNRAMNLSYAMEILPFQDQMTNILSQMLLNMKQSLVQFWLANEDALEDDQVKHLKETVKSPGYYIHPSLLLYEGEKLRDMGIESKDVLHIVSTKITNIVGEAMTAIRELIGVVDQLLILSTQEKGQSAPREISATETNVINASTNSMYSFIGEGVDELRSGLKKMLAEHYLACSESDFLVPVHNKYEDSVVDEAGLEVGQDNAANVAGMLIRGKAASLMPSNMIHEFVFTSRDGVDRMSNAQGAQALTQLIGNLQNIPTVLEGINKSDFYGMVNHIFRLVGVYDVTLKVAPGQDGPVAPPTTPPNAAVSPSSPDSGAAQIAAIAELQAQMDSITQQLAQVTGAEPPPAVEQVAGL